MYNRGGYIHKLSSSSGLVFLEKDWDGERLPEDLIEEAGLTGHELKLLESQSRAQLAGYSKQGNIVTFEFKLDRNSMINKNCSNFYLASEINGWERAIGNPLWLFKSVDKENSVFQLKMDWLYAQEIGYFAFKFVSENSEWIEPKPYLPTIEKNNFGSTNFIFCSKRTGKDIFTFEIVKGPETQNLNKWHNFSPRGKFGYSQSSTGSSFRVFAPRVQEISLLLFSNSENEKYEKYNMSKKEDGCWEINLPIQCEGLSYKYLVKNIVANDVSKTFSKEIIDPYARAVTSRDGKGIAICVQENYSKKKFITPPVEKLVILETHIRDLLANAPIPKDLKNQFNGLTEWLKSDDCYLKKLGVNTVELQPVLEFDAKNKEEYHWGYMPVNLFSPASVYGSNPEDGSVTLEFQKLVNAFHDAGITVIIDVVYNHFGVPNHLTILDRELYLSTDENGQLTNHSGCGNDINSNSGASKKIIIDSLKSLIQNYSVDGFRFDLGELLGIDLLQEIEDELVKEFPNIILIAEPWSFRGRLPERINRTKYSLWSDLCREELFKFITGNANKNAILDLLMGKLDSQNLFPWQSVNYLESHDDYAFIDRLCSPKEWQNGTPPLHTIKKAKLAIAILLLSPGIPMLASGQDFLKSKKGVRNTYQRGDLNALDYSSLDKFQCVHEWVKKLISFRISEDAKMICLKNYLPEDHYEVIDGPSNSFGLIIHECKRTLKDESIVIFVNANDNEINFELPAKINDNEYEEILGDKISIFGLAQPMEIQLWKTKKSL